MASIIVILFFVTFDFFEFCAECCIFIAASLSRLHYGESEKTKRGQIYVAGFTTLSGDLGWNLPRRGQGKGVGRDVYASSKPYFESELSVLFVGFAY